MQELEAQQVFDKVVIVTHSDFARTLTPNSNAGTDHGWSGIQMVPWFPKERPIQIAGVVSKAEQQVHQESSQKKDKGL